jgi:hypothetical protein
MLWQKVLPLFERKLTFIKVSLNQDKEIKREKTNPRLKFSDK